MSPQRVSPQRVHLATGGPVGTACGAGARWLSSQITSTRGTRLVNCRACQRTAAWARACDLRALENNPGS